MRLDRESASRFECRLRDVVSGTGPFGKPCPVSSRNSGTQFPSEVPWGKSDPEFAWIVGRTFRRAVPPQLRRVATRCITTCKSATLVQHASVAQGIEHRSPKAGVDGSNPPGGTREYDGVAIAAPFLVCGDRRRIRTVDTRVANFPAGGVFEFARGHQRNIEPGTTTVPGSFGVRAAPFHASGSHQKQSARLPGEQAGASERICLRRSLRR